MKDLRDLKDLTIHDVTPTPSLQRDNSHGRRQNRLFEAGILAKGSFLSAKSKSEILPLSGCINSVKSLSGETNFLSSDGNENYYTIRFY